MNVTCIQTARNARGVFRPMDFDTLECFRCEAPCPPRKVSAGPTVSYKCSCGASWRIDKDGDQTHTRFQA